MRVPTLAMGLASKRGLGGDSLSPRRTVIHSSPKTIVAASGSRTHRLAMMTCSGIFLALRMVALSVGGLVTLSFPFKLEGVFNGQSLFLCVSKVLGLFEGEYRGLRSNLALR